MIGVFRQQDGFFPAYHMNKEHWISILLDRPELDGSIKKLLQMSYELTEKNKKDALPKKR